MPVTVWLLLTTDLRGHTIASSIYSSLAKAQDSMPSRKFKYSHDHGCYIAGDDDRNFLLAPKELDC